MEQSLAQAEVYQTVELWMSVVGGLVTILLAIVAYFLKGLHKDLNEMMKHLNEVTTRLSVQEEKGRGGHRELTLRVDNHEDRLKKLEA